MSNNVLIIGRDSEHLDVVLGIFADHFPNTNIVRCGSIGDGIIEMKKYYFGLLVIDLSMDLAVERLGGIPTPPAIAILKDNTVTEIYTHLTKNDILDIVAFVVLPIENDFIPLLKSALINYN